MISSLCYLFTLIESENGNVGPEIAERLFFVNVVAKS